jgi:hypothetical protein
MDVADLIRCVNAPNEAVEDACEAVDIASHAGLTAELGASIPKLVLTRDPGAGWRRRADWSRLDLPEGNGSLLASSDGQLCGLFAVDVAGFNGLCRDDDIQIYIHESLYEMLHIAFDRSGVPWFICIHEDRGDGVLVIVPPVVPIAGLVDPIPERLRGLVRRHNRVSCEAARIQLRVAVHIGPVHNDGHGFVGRDVNLLCRLLDARPLKRMLAESGAEVAFITSGYVYENVIRRRPSLVDPAVFQSLAVRVKETRTRAWAYVLGTLPPEAAVVTDLVTTRGPGLARPPRSNPAYSWVVTALTSV